MFAEGAIVPGSRSGAWLVISAWEAGLLGLQGSACPTTGSNRHRPLIELAGLRAGEYPPLRSGGDIDTAEG